MPIFCSPFCGQPVSELLRLLNCERESDTAKKCKRLSPLWNSEERRWSQRNGSVLKTLASIVNKPLQQVSGFMFELTMKKFGEIINPKCSRWTHCRVPFVRPYTCLLYDGIYDRRGNLRPTFHPYIQQLVVSILDHFLNLPCEVDKPPSKRPEYEMFSSRKGTTCKDFLKSGRNGNADLANLLENQTFSFGDDSRNNNVNGTSGKDGFNDTDADTDRDGNNSNENNGYDEENDKNKNKNKTTNGNDNGNRRGSRDGSDDGSDDGSGHGNGKRNKNRKKNAGDDDNGGVGKNAKNKGGKAKNRENKKSIAEISNLYSNVVENNQPLIKKKPPPKKKPFRGAGRKYLGVMLPVLMHEPFDDSKPWTWIRRHPIQERVLEGIRVGRANIHKYKRASLEAQLLLARKGQSVGSIYGVKDHPSIISLDMFGKAEVQKKGTPLLQPFNYKRLFEKPEESPTVASKPTSAKKPVRGK
ncbi:uncharacterized protein LOC115563231 [Drosophila navojoa]|uniref:uncharacterized protein LOC115563231 n=1 Tax=Drosophila navojoa TaxID=7232 RepID=UPI0011BF7636|nr:uncharacterized protein LOC115563231 [Drosophila navojoa]